MPEWFTPHRGKHVAAVVKHEGTVLGVEHFPTARHGRLILIGCMRGFGILAGVGVE
ncbi:MAG: hypothetical protein M0Z29_09540 [Actinomycetota bacterium]|nr:hypothetical protein [Actinomycetota bacterium]